MASSQRTLESIFSDENTRILPLAHIAPRNSKAIQLEPLITSIEEHGLEFPLFCDGPVDHLEAAKRRWVLDLDTPDPDATYWLVNVGNQRFQAALALGYTHISASLWPTAQQSGRNPLALQCRGTQWVPGHLRKPARKRQLGEPI